MGTIDEEINALFKDQIGKKKLSSDEAFAEIENHINLIKKTEGIKEYAKKNKIPYNTIINTMSFIKTGERQSDSSPVLFQKILSTKYKEVTIIKERYFLIFKKKKD